jgi:hypothetical protein
MNGTIVLAGCLVGAGTALIITWLAPAQPDLDDALARIDPVRGGAGQTSLLGDTDDALVKIGARIRRAAPALAGRAPAADLALLSISTERFLGERAGYATIGLLFPPLFTTVVGALGMHLPIATPAVAGLLMAVLFSFVPALEVRRKAAAAREDFTRATAAYIDLAAMERRAAGGVTQSLESAAQVADSWPFLRIREALARAHWAGLPAWDALAQLGDELQVPALTDLGGIMRVGGEHGAAALHDALTARAASARDAVLAHDQARANAASEALAMPVAALGLVFLALLSAPALLRIALG